MHKINDCGCQEACPECAIGPFSRNHYFTGKLLVERDFRDEQTYFIDKLRHHQQLLHGWGVICGLQVVEHPNPACQNRIVCIEPGAAVDCCGHDIVVRERDCIDVTALSGYDDLSGSTDTHTLQICLKYKECPTEKIPVLYDDCSCDDTQCAPNRILESYDVGLIVDPPSTPDTAHAPGLSWSNSVSIADAVKTIVHAPTTRMYVLNASGTVFPIRTDNHSVLTPLALSGSALDLAVSNDGQRLYVVVDLNPRELHVFDTTDLSAAPLHTLPIAGSDNSALELAVMPSPANRLVALTRETGQITVWQTDINNAAGTPASPDTIALAANLQGVALSSDGTKAYSMEPSQHRIQVADIATKAPAPALPVPPGTLDLAGITTVRLPGPDRLALVSRTERLLALLQPGVANVKTAALDHPPEFVSVSADGVWAYVVEHDGTDSFLQLVNLARVWSGQTGAVMPAFPLGANSALAVPVPGGLYVPWLGDAQTVGDGGVAILEVSETECLDIFRRTGTCCTCDTADCIVLATIENYRVGDRLLNQTAPASDPIADAAAHIARLNNIKDRRLLPSTQTLLKVIECIADHGTGAPGPQGPPGPQGSPGDDGPPGLGLNPDLPKILDIGWNHAGVIRADVFTESNRYDAHPSEILNSDRLPALTIYFNREDLRGIDRQSFRVSLAFPRMIDGRRFTGLYDIVDLYGYLLDLGPRNTPHTGEAAKSAWAFVPYREFFENSHGLFPRIWDGRNNYSTQFDDLQLDMPVLRIALKGDFVWTGPDFLEDGTLDADNVGGRVGLNVARSGPITGGQNPSGNLTQGGDFESWLYLEQPVVVPGPATRGGADFGISPEAPVPASPKAATKDRRKSR